MRPASAAQIAAIRLGDIQPIYCLAVYERTRIAANAVFATTSDYAASVVDGITFEAANPLLLGVQPPENESAKVLRDDTAVQVADPDLAWRNYFDRNWHLLADQWVLEWFLIYRFENPSLAALVAEDYRGHVRFYSAEMPAAGGGYARTLTLFATGPISRFNRNLGPFATVEQLRAVPGYEDSNTPQTLSLIHI